MIRVRVRLLVSLAGFACLTLGIPAQANRPRVTPPAAPLSVAGLWDVFRVVEDLDDLRDGDITEITPIEDALQPIESALDSVGSVIDDIQDITNDPVQDRQDDLDDAIDRVIRDVETFYD